MHEPYTNSCIWVDMSKNTNNCSNVKLRKISACDIFIKEPWTDEIFQICDLPFHEDINAFSKLGVK